MNAALNYCWRLAATGFCFFAFSAGGLLLTLFVFPALLLTSRRDRAQHARRAIRQSFRLFLWIMEGLVEGKAEAVLQFLAARGLDVPDDVRRRVLACRDPGVLNTWIQRAAVAATAAEVVAEDR